jgi:hypothetical protein
MSDQPIRVQGAFAAPAVGGGVPDRDRPVVAHRVGDAEQDRALRGGEFAGRGGEGERPEYGVEPAGEPLRQDPPDLGRGRLARRARRRHQPRAAPGDQPEQHGERLLVAQHERGHAVPGGEPVPAVAAAHRLHRHVEVEQMIHVPPNGPAVHAEPAG